MMTKKQQQQAKIDLDTALFLAKGGKVQAKDHTDNQGYQIKQHETRAEVRARSKREFKVNAN